MARTVTIPLQAATTKAYVIDRDSVLVSAASMVSGANAVIVSTDPALTAAQILAAPGATVGITGDILLAIVPNSAAFAQNLQIPLSKDRTIYLNSGQATWVFLLLEDDLSAQNLVT